MTLLYALVWSFLLLLRYALCFVQKVWMLLFWICIPILWKWLGSGRGGRLCKRVLLAQKVRSTSLQFSDKLPYFTTDITLEFENSPVWHTFRFELRIFTQCVCSLADRKYLCLCVCCGGVCRKGIKTNNFFNLFSPYPL